MLEKRLAQDVCLRDLASLRREYRFATRRDRVQRNLVSVEIQKAGYRGLPGGKFVLEPIDPAKLMMDDGQYFSATATYRINTDELDLWACGMNFGGIRHEPRF